MKIPQFLNDYAEYKFQLFEYASKEIKEEVRENIDTILNYVYYDYLTIDEAIYKINSLHNSLYLA